MARRQMEWQWNRAMIMQTIERLDRFIRLSGVDDDLVMLEAAIDRCRVDPTTAREYLVAREIARKMLNLGKRFEDIRRVVAWRTPESRVEVEYIDSAVESLL